MGKNNSKKQAIHVESCTILLLGGYTFLGVLYFLDKVWYNTKKNSGKNAVLLHGNGNSTKCSQIIQNKTGNLPGFYKILLESMV